MYRLTVVRLHPPRRFATSPILTIPPRAGESLSAGFPSASLFAFRSPPRIAFRSASGVSFLLMPISTMPNQRRSPLWFALSLIACICTQIITMYFVQISELSMTATERAITATETKSGVTLLRHSAYGSVKYFNEKLLGYFLAFLVFGDFLACALAFPAAVADALALRSLANLKTGKNIMGIRPVFLNLSICASANWAYLDL